MNIPGDNPPTPKSPPSWSSPLGIIALFLTVTETVTGIAVMQATGVIQIALTCYVIVLPLLVLAAFFFVLWHKPYVLYPPSEYGRGVDVHDYVSAMQRSVLNRREIDESRILDIVQRSIGSVVAAETHSPNEREHSSPDAGTIAKMAIARIDEHLVTVDISPIVGEKKVRKIPFDEGATVGDFLNDIYFSLEPHVHPMRYDLEWILVDERTGKVFHDLGTSWARGRGKPSDDRRLGEVGIGPGTFLHAHRLPLAV